MKECPLQAVGNKVIIKRDAAEKKTASGLFIADDAQEAPTKGVVVNVGQGKFNEKTGERDPIQVKVGQRVLFKEHSGHTVTVDGETFLIIRADDVYAVLEED